MSKIAIQLIKCYQYFSKNLIRYNVLPLVFISGCRSYPTCSDYMIKAIRDLGFWKGALKGLIRIIKCNPLATNN